MSESDNLKSTFEDAFAAEQIAFDPAAWNQMNALLNQRYRRRAFWIWLSSIGLFIGLSSGILFGFSAETVYVPRINQITMLDSDLNSELDESTFYGTNARPQSSRQQTRRTIQSQPKNGSSDVAMTNPPTKNAISSGVVNQLNSDDQNGPTKVKTLPVSTQANSSIDKTVSIASAGVDASSIIDDQSDEQDQTEMDDAQNLPPETYPSGNFESVDEEVVIDALDYMPILDLPFSYLRSVDDLNYEVEPNKTQFLPSLYLMAGVSQTLDASFRPYQGIGQAFGVGYSRQIRHHLIVGAEIDAMRIRAADTAQIAGQTTYGFNAYENYYVVTTQELLRFAVPVFAHYRAKRLYFGGGIAPWVLGGLKNATEQSLRQEGIQPTTQETTRGYFQWNRYRRFGLDAILDLQYQIHDDTFIGIRGSYNLTDALSINNRQLHMTSISAYLKLNIR